MSTSILSLLLSLATGWAFTFNSESLPLLVGMGIVYFIAVSMYYTGLSKIELSTVTILEATGAIHSFLLGIVLLGESFTMMKTLGITLVISAVLIISLSEKKQSFSNYSLVILASIFFYALGAVFDKQLNTFGNPLSYITLSFAIAGISILLVYYKRTKIAVNETFRFKVFW
ncbi:EamA family transporter [bacterium]|nr:EamA family transporter [bacterium]